MREIAVGRVVGLIVAIGGFGAAFYFARMASLLNIEFHQWMEDRPFHAPVDLSQPGEFTFPFRQTCSVSHGAAVCLAITPEPDKPVTTVDLAKDLSGSISIEDSSGNKVAESSFDIEAYTQWYDSQEVVLGDLDPTLPPGDYNAKIRIDTGAPALTGKKQTMYAKYFLCGLEQTPVVIAGAISFVVGAVGFIVGGCIFPGLWELGFRRANQSDEVE